MVLIFGTVNFVSDYLPTILTIQKLVERAQCEIFRTTVRVVSPLAIFRIIHARISSGVTDSGENNLPTQLYKLAKIV